MYLWYFVDKINQLWKILWKCPFERTTEGTNGGVIFFAIRSSQLIGEKKEWYLSSSWKEKEANWFNNLMRVFVTCGEGRDVYTHKVVLGPQPLGAVLLQQPLQQFPPCVWHVGLEHRGLVQDVVVHLGCVATVERRLFNESGDNEFSLFTRKPTGLETQRDGFYLQVRRASRTAPIPGTTSPLFGHMLVSGGPQGPSTVGESYHVNTRLHQVSSVKQLRLDRLKV